MSSFLVILDACVLHKGAIRDTLLRTAEVPALFRPLWTEDIWAEVESSLRTRKHPLTERQIAHLSDQVRRSFESSFLDDEGYRELVPCRSLPDPGDRHVLAAGIHAGAQVIVSDDKKGFPEPTLARHGIEIRTKRRVSMRSIRLATRSDDRRTRDAGTRYRRIRRARPILFGQPGSTHFQRGSAELSKPWFNVLTRGSPLLSSGDMPPKEKRGYPTSRN